jgi:hypothetical protein
MPLYQPAAQLMNYAREIAVMDEDQFRNHFNSMSDHLNFVVNSHHKSFFVEIIGATLLQNDLTFKSIY